MKFEEWFANRPDLLELSQIAKAQKAKAQGMLDCLMETPDKPATCQQLAEALKASLDCQDIHFVTLLSR